MQENKSSLAVIFVPFFTYNQEGDAMKSNQIKKEGGLVDNKLRDAALYIRVR